MHRPSLQRKLSGPSVQFSGRKLAFGAKTSKEVEEMEMEWNCLEYVVEVTQGGGGEGKEEEEVEWKDNRLRREGKDTLHSND